MEIATKLIDAIAHFISVIVWPLALLFIVQRFSPELKRFIGSRGNVDIDVLGVKANLSIKEEVVTALGGAEAQNPNDDLNDETIKRKIAAVSEVAGRFTSIKYLVKLRTSRVLWVDDHPSNNIFQTQAFESVGIKVDIATSTEQALQLISSIHFNAIISDMGRPPDMRAGYTLLSKLGENHPPYIIFSSSADPAHDQEAKRNGALGSTNSPTTLFGMVATAIAGGA